MLRKFYHYCLTLLGAIIYRFPSSRIFVVGVTGTKGKSTVIELINSILEAAGKKTALSSSIRVKIADKSQRNSTDNTMPGRFFIQRFLRKAVNLDCEIALIEVTSQGISQNRHRFIDWSAAIFTNLAAEHIEAHKGFENYRQAKLSFFEYVKNQEGAKLFFINKDDLNANYFIEAARKENSKIVLYSGNDIQNINLETENLKFVFPENIAAAIAFCLPQGINQGIIKKALENFPGVPGRMELIQKEPFKVIIDYAHTPDSLEKIYKLLGSRLICVLGSAGGGRDKWKRPKMGEIAAKYCTKIILTNEDPYDENPQEILNQIETGIPNSRIYSGRYARYIEHPAHYKILNRQEAIKKAVSLAQKNDTIIITGKGCESCIHIKKGKKIPWDEKKIVEEILSGG